MTVTNEPGVTTFSTPSADEVTITRVLDAPKALVFEVHTRPEHVRHWLLGPPGWTMPICEIDLRPGGTFRYVWRRADGTEMTITGEYVEVIAPERVVNTEAWGGDWPATRNTMALTESAGRTTVTTTIRYVSPAARDAALQTGMADGVGESFARLDNYLASL